MSLIEAFILGLVQGLTEFIPVSSSAHLVILHDVFNVPSRALTFDVALHGGTLIALIGYFYRDIAELARALVVKGEKTLLARLIMYATIPAAVIGYLLEGVAESSFRSVQLVASTMLAFAIIMLLAERYYSRRRQHMGLGDMKLREAMVMGFAQALAIVPGVSRSGSTITAGLFAGLDRVAATRFSFLLGIPITFGAVLRIGMHQGFVQHVQANQAVFAVGIMTALLSGLLAIRFMLKYLAKHGLHAFAYYRIAFAIVAFIVLSVR